MYRDSFSKTFTKKVLKLKKKDPKHYFILYSKINWILANAEHRFKFLQHGKKGMQRIHIGHFVLVFVVDYSNKSIFFEDYDHHDKIYI
ncbi:hypothetical protein CL616_05155 [archaeon]|nr:hypothetical protein [archaeon]